MTPKYDVGPGSPMDMLGEECAEAVKEIFKAYRFGADTMYIGTSKAKDDNGYRTTTPRQRLVQEVGDILVSVDLCITLGFFSAADIEHAKEKKRLRLIELFGHNYADRMPRYSVVNKLVALVPITDAILEPDEDPLGR